MKTIEERYEEAGRPVRVTQIKGDTFSLTQLEEEHWEELQDEER